MNQDNTYNHLEKVVRGWNWMLSIALHPLLIPTIGVGMFLYMLPFNIGTGLRWGLFLLPTFLYTCLLPLSSIIILRWRGKISLSMENASQRNVPYLYTIIGFGFWNFYLSYTLHAPIWMLWVGVGSMIALTLVWIINHKWKISAHLTAIGGLTGGIYDWAFFYGKNPEELTILIILSIALLLMYARINLKAHTPSQVVAGYLLGLICTTIPWLIWN